MKIAYYRNQSNEMVPCLVTSKGLINIESLDLYNKNDLTGLSLIQQNDLEKKILGNDSVKFKFLNGNGLSFGPCLPTNGKIICIGLNYRKHAEESGMPIPETPVVFTKYSNTLTDFGSDIPLGKEGIEFDYEVELGVIIGKNCKNVSKAEALNYVMGYCVANDLSCRDLQFKTSQWLLGKSLDKFLPLGKYFVSANEINNPQNLQLTCTVNGEVRQLSNTSDMIFSVAEIIAYLSKHMTLETGDLILTGTPEGVIMGRSDKKWLRPGDVVKVEIEKIGSTQNMMV
ncbi:MAG: fumarylacetoacetate hydrolase family protein [Bacteroidota bacterium]